MNSFEYLLPKIIVEKLWKDLADIPVDKNGEFTEEPFLHFGVGTHRENIWHWFEDVQGYSPWRPEGERWNR